MTRSDILLKVKSSISDYLRFDVDDLFLKSMGYGDFSNGDPFNSTPKRVDDAYIFGGAIRDSLADVPIKDIDIIGRSESLTLIGNYLKYKHGFVLNNDYMKKSSNDIYSNGLIFEPDSYIKIVDNNMICVQLIKPSNNPNFMKSIIDSTNLVYPWSSEKEKRNVPENLNKLISIHVDPTFKYKEQILNLNLIVNNVDISCCGISYCPSRGLVEHHFGAIYHSLKKIYSLNPEAIMYNENRIYQRVKKMDDKGFKLIDESNLIKLNRAIKLFNLDI